MNRGDRTRERPGRPDGSREEASEARLRELLREAGPRRSLPEEDLARLREAARAAWERRSGKRQTGRHVRWGAWLAAAAALGGLALALRWLSPAAERRAAPPVVSAFAQLERVTGTLEVRGVGEASWVRWGEERKGSALAVGAEIRTGEGAAAGRAALGWPDGASLRLDHGSVLRLRSQRDVVLERGAVYIASGESSNRERELSVVTPQGRFAEVGTQFEVRVDSTAGWSRLRVREGRVELSRDGEREAAEAGEELMVRSGGAIERGGVPRFGDPWDWAIATAPMLDIEGITARSFLEWTAREGGWRLEFADRGSEELADRAVLHGSIRRLTPSSAPAAVLPTAGLDFTLHSGVLRVAVANEPRTPR